jgi:hypothetical protein
MLENLPSNPWLVACGDMLLMVDLSFCSGESIGTGKYDFNRIMFEVFRLDFSAGPAKWVKMREFNCVDRYLSAAM